MFCDIKQRTFAIFHIIRIAYSCFAHNTLLPTTAQKYGMPCYMFQPDIVTIIYSRNIMKTQAVYHMSVNSQPIHIRTVQHLIDVQCYDNCRDENIRAALQCSILHYQMCCSQGFYSRCFVRE